MISDIALKFKSGNSIPVDRAIITADEWKEIVDYIAAKEEEISMLKKQCKGE